MNRSLTTEAALVLTAVVALAAPAALAAPWPLADPAAHAVDIVRLRSTADRIGQLQGVDGLLVAHRGELIVERYFRDGAADHPHNLKSASKSVLSALAGIAIEEGLLRLDQPIAELLPDSPAFADPAKRAITVRHLLTMTTGLEPTSYDTYNEWIQSRDWVESALARPLVAEPGTFYQYSTGTTHILSAVLASASGMTTRQYAERRLFGPLDIEIKGWQQDPAGTYVGGNNLSLLPRDMLRFGQLYLDGGRSGDRQILPASWVEESTRTGQSGLHVVYGTYRYLWWTDLFYRGAFSAVGYGGQYIYVSPAHDTVIVVTSTLESKGLEWTRRLYALLRNGILASFEPSANYFTARGRPPIDPALDSLTQALAATEAEVAHLRDELSELPPTAARGRTTSRVNLREQPDTASRRLAVLERGIAFDVLEHSGAWLQVRTADREGWLHSDYARLNEETTWRATLAPLGAELASFVSAARRALRDGSEASGEADPAGDDQVPLRLDGPDPVFAAEEGEVNRLTGRAGEFDAPQPEPRRGVDPARLELEAARQELASQASALSEARNEAEALRAELEAARAAYRQLEALGEERDRALASLAEARSRVETLEQQAVTDAASARKRSEDLVADLGQAVDRATAAEARTARAQSSAQAAALERDRLAAELESERHDRGTAVQTAEAEARSRQGEISRLGAELETARAQNAELAESLQKEKEAGVEGASERDRLEAELAAARERLSGELSERQLDSAALDALEQERDRLAAELESTRQAQGRSVRELESLRRAQEESRAGLEAQIETARAQAAGLADELQASQRKLEEEAGERQRLATDLAATRDRMNEEVRTERAKSADLRTDLETAEAAGAELTRQRDGLAADLESARQEAQRVGEALAGAESEGRRLASELETSRQALSQLRGELAEARSRGTGLAEADSKLATLRSELATLRSELETAESGGANLTRERDALASDLEAARRALEASEATLAATRAAGRNASLASASLSNDLETAQASAQTADNRAAAAEGRAAAAGNRAAAAETRAAEAEAARDSLADQLATANDQLAAASEQASSASSRAAELERTRRQLAAELEAAQEARRRAEEGSRSSSSELDGRVADLTAQLAAESAQSEAARSALDDSAAALDRAREELVRARAEATTVAGERDTALERVAGLEAQARELQQTVADTRRQLAEAQRPAPVPAPTQEPRLAELEEALARSEVTSQEQARELDGLRRELTGQRDELADAVSDRTELAEALDAERAESARLERRVVELEQAASAARAAAPPRADASGVAGGRGGVQGFVRSWAQALSRRDLDRFLSFYSRSFEPPNGLTLREWGQRRLAELSDPAIRGLELGGIEVAPLASGGTSTRFVYRLKTSERDITTTKTLDLVWEGGGWRVLREAPLLR